jgi:hypothetical protein
MKRKAKQSKEESNNVKKKAKQHVEESNIMKRKAKCMKRRAAR